MFNNLPYPSGAGLHVGHPLGYIASDIIARYKNDLTWPLSVWVKKGKIYPKESLNLILGILGRNNR